MNLPPELVPPLHDALLKDIEYAQSNEVRSRCAPALCVCARAPCVAPIPLLCLLAALPVRELMDFCAVSRHDAW